MTKRLPRGMVVGALLAVIFLVALAISFSPVQAALSWPTYTVGSSGENVTTIQYLLLRHQLSVETDGHFGPTTEEAVKHFQKQFRLKVDGIVDSNAWTKLVVTIRSGSQGDAVTALQRQLNRYGAKLSVDGIAGPTTALAIQNFQKKHQLAVTGVAGPETWNKLVSGNGDDSDNHKNSNNNSNRNTNKNSNDGTYTVIHTPTISASFINLVLAAYNSPAKGKGQALYNYGVQYGIDPAYALAFFKHESTFGLYGAANQTHSLGNIRCSSGYDCYQAGNNGSFRSYATWEAGFEDWYRLIRDTYVGSWHLTTIDQIIPTYAPADDNNDTTAYIRDIKMSVHAWRDGVLYEV